MNSTDEKVGVGGGFAAGTPVHTADGSMPIEKIQIGDLVLSLPEAGGEVAYKRVLSVVSHEDRELILVAFVVGDESTPRHLVVAGDHAFWVCGKGWLPR
jgi:hypothetical protein